jgi:ABC-2 type transport system permease protein
LVVPADFDSALQAGSQPQVHLYLNDSTLQVQGRNLVTAAILNYARTVAQPQPPVTLVTALVNPSSDDAAVILTQVYVPITLLLSLIIGTTFVPQMLIEEKERKTLRMLMVTPASFEDILLGKLLVVLVYQIILTCVVLAIMSSFTGQIGLILLYVVLGACFSLALGLFFGSAFNSLSAATTVSGLVILLYVISGIFVGRMGEILGGSSPVVKLARILPTYYIADGVFNAAQGAGSAGSHLLNIGIILVSTVALLILSIWILRRQSAVTGSL